MTHHNQNHSLPSGGGLADNHQKATTEADVAISSALADRPPRQPDFAAENQALHTLAQKLTDDPLSILKTVVEMALDLGRADTAGVSLLETLADGTSVFRWVAIAGALKSWEQTTIPAKFSPCTATIQGEGAQLYARPQLYFTYLHHPQFPIAESLLFPIRAGDRKLGTIWLISHNQQRQFDREDERLITSLASFSAAALQNIHLRQMAELALQQEQMARRETEAIREAFAQALPGNLHLLENISDRQQAELVLVEEKRLLELTATGKPLEECLSALCTSVSKLNPQVRACILLADATRQTFHNSIAPDFPTGFSLGLKDAPINELAIGTCGEAVYRVGPIICVDIAKDDSWSQQWRDLCVVHGVLACHSSPIVGLDHLPLGSLMLCFGEPRMPTDWEYRLANFGTQIASIVLQRDRASDSLRESEAKYRTLTELSTHHVWMLDATGEVVYLNQTFVDYFGKSLNELKRKNWAENVHHPDDHSRVIQEIARAMAAGINIRSEHRLRRYDNQFRWFLNEATPLRDAHGQITHWVGASVDIHDSKQAEAALRQMSGELERELRKFDAIASSVPDFIYTFDLSGRFTYVNPPLLHLWQKTAAEAMGKNFFELDYPTDLATKLQNQIQQVMETGKQLKDETPYTSGFGTRAYEYIFVPLFDENGAVEAVAGVTRDITDRKQAEAALRVSEEKFRNMADNAPCMIWVTDETCYCTYLSQSWYEFTGQTEATGLGFGWLNATHPDDRQFTQQMFMAANERHDVFRIEYRLRGSDGRYIWAIYAASPWFGPEGEFKGYIGSVIDIDDRKQSESALRQSEERYRTLFESIDEGFSVIEVLFDQNNQPIDYRFLEINPAFENQTGLQQATGKTARQLVPNLEDHWVETYGKIALTGESMRFENGSEAMNRWFDVYAFPIGQPQERKVAILFTDISDRKRMEVEREQAKKALLSSEERIRNILESISDGFFALDEDWRFTYVNPQAEFLLDRTPADLLGKNFWLEFPGLIGSEFEQLYWGVMKHRVSASLTGFYPDQNRWYEVHCYPAAHGITTYFRNVTDRKQVEEELRQKNAILEVINESAPTPIFVKDREGRIIYANPATLEVLGKSASEVVGYRDRDFYPSSDLGERVMENDRRIMASGQTEVVEESPDGIRTFLGMKAPYRNEAGVVIGLIGISYDISERKRIESEREQVLQREQSAREAAENANRIKDEFLAVLSHELRSPLNPILGWARLLRRGKLDGAKRAQALETIERNAQLQSQLIEDLLDISRIMRGKLTMVPMPVNLSFVVSAAIETVRLAAEAKSIHIEVNVEPNIKKVYGDGGRLQQVVWNLLSNAVKFTPTGGVVRVDLTETKGYAQLQVRDTGKGINSEFLPYVFEHFRQEDGATTRQFGGLGLGLAIARQIVELHGGRIWVESRGENQGATFTLELPILDTVNLAEEVADTTLAPSKDLLLENLDVLVVEDNPDSRDFLAFVLKQAGAEVTAVGSAIQALQLLSTVSFDILLSDIGMPEMDGYALIAEVRQSLGDRVRQIPAIALTAYAGEQDQQKAIASGFQNHMAKPIDPQEIVAVVARMCRRN
ncbi:MAG: PAS domain S-box protein [Microcoleus sp.]